MSKENCKKCNNENCIGYYLLHPKEMKDIESLKAKHPSAEFELLDSPSSGEMFTKFRELHVRVLN